MSEPLVLQGAAPDRDLTKLAAYREVGGYDQLEQARGMEPQALIDELLAANLRGRGGAGFPMGQKASFLAKGTGKPTYLVVNADESEPGTFKDREIMFTVPHRLIEGCLITAHAIGAEHVFIYIRGEYLEEFEILRAALEQVAQGEAARRRHDRPPPRRRRLHLRRGDGAARVARGRARPAADEAAVPGGGRPVRVADAHQQRRDDRDRAADRRDGRRRVREGRRRELAPARASSRSRATS